MRIVLSASILDLCHEGHLNLLREMRKSGDMTIMVIHTDESCYHIKGKFPVWDLKHRIRAAKMTGLVDKIYVAKNNDPADVFKKIVKKYKKHEFIYIRGNDNLKFPGRWFIEERNIPIRFIDYTEGVSSTQIRQKLLNGVC